MKLRPLGNKVVIIPDQTEETTAGGIFIANKEPYTNTGSVTAVGPDATEFAQGDRIIFVKGTGNEVQLDDNNIVILEPKDVIGKINNALEPVLDVIVCTDADFGDQTTTAGIIIKSNIADSQGITSRWMRVHKVGPNVDFVQPGQWVLVEYGRWTESFDADGIEDVYRVDPKGCMAVADEKPETLYYNSDVVASERKSVY